MKAKRLKTLTDLPIKSDPLITFLTEDSREVTPGTLFFARSGKEHDGTKFINAAIANGAVAVVTSLRVVVPESIELIVVSDVEMTERIIASRFYEVDTYPMRFVGITGTDGKTSFTYIAEKILTELGLSVGVIGTINVRFKNRVIETNHTTPTFLKLHSLLDQMREAKVDVVVMEVSSHALAQDRIHGLKFDVANFSNIKQDHLDYHKTAEEYFKAKSLLFTKYLKGTAILNGDDPLILKLKIPGAIFFGKSQSGDTALLDFEFDSLKTKFRLGDKSVTTNLVGEFNIYNVTQAILSVEALGFERKRIIEILKNIRIKVPGRLEEAIPNLYVDYAHTPNALLKAISALKEISIRPIITIFGCGGDRDKTKRPLMGKNATQNSAMTIITSDNPRSENPDAIIEDIKEGITEGHYLTITDRKKAIDLAVKLQVSETLLVAGKGHENYQIIGKEVLPFDDVLVAKESHAKRKNQILVIGYGISGKAILDWALKNGRAVFLHDKGAPNILKEHQKIIKRNFTEEELAQISDFSEYDFILFSPGIHLTPNLESEFKNNHLMMNEIDFAYLILKKPVYAVTGTNGKTTTTLMLAHALKNLGVRCIASGNVGYPMTSAALRDEEFDAYVVELSSFQIERLKYLLFDGLIFLNLAPDHLDHYQSLDDYYNAKKKIFSRRKSHAVIINGLESIKEPSSEFLPLVKKHQSLFIHPQNTSAVIALLCELKYSSSDISRALFDFVAPAHRMEFVTSFKGTKIYNDSKSTNLHSLESALSYFKKSDHLLLLISGKDKEEDYERILPHLRERVTHIFSSGGAAKRFAPYLISHGIALTESKTLKESLIKAFEYPAPNKVILLSPGLPSFDEFKNFEHRGDEYKKMVIELKGIYEQK